MTTADHPHYFVCTYCHKPVAGKVEFSIHRDGFGEGPEVPLCRRCGDGDEPSCSDIWARISQTPAPVSAPAN